MDALSRKTLEFFLGQMVAELERDLDWRAQGSGRSVIGRVLIYSAAMARDLARIPLHHPAGIAQARFRARIAYIEEIALPTLQFFRTEYDHLGASEAEALDRAIAALESAVGLTTDGPLPALDTWYATMDEFRGLTDLSRQAAVAMHDILGDGSREPSADDRGF